MRELDTNMAQLDLQQLQASTRNQKSYATKTFFSYLEEHGHIDRNPSDGLVSPKMPKKEPQFLSE